jgi:GNAT superfamily N-acetyltransferase
MPTAANSAASESSARQPVIGPLAERDLPEAERIFRVAFGTFLGVPEPETFWSDRDYVHGRWRAPHVVALGATLDGRLVGSNFATRWGSVGYFGPITVRADLQEHGIGKVLLAATMDQFDAWGTRHAGLFTFAQSAKHVALYQKFGFHARFLTAIMSAPARREQPMADWSRYGALSDAERDAALLASRQVTDTLYPGLDLSEEIRAVQAQGLGDTVLVQGGDGVARVCHLSLWTAQRGRRRYVLHQVRRGSRHAVRGTRLPAVAGRLRGARGGRGHAEPVGRREPGALRGLSAPCRSGFPHRDPGRRHASAERSGLLPAGRLHHRRLAIVSSD